MVFFIVYNLYNITCLVSLAIKLKENCDHFRKMTNSIDHHPPTTKSKLVLTLLQCLWLCIYTFVSWPFPKSFSIQCAQCTKKCANLSKGRPKRRWCTFHRRFCCCRRLANQNLNLGNMILKSFSKRDLESKNYMQLLMLVSPLFGIHHTLLYTRFKIQQLGQQERSCTLQLTPMIQNMSISSGLFQHHAIDVETRDMTQNWWWNSSISQLTTPYSVQFQRQAPLGWVPHLWMSAVTTLQVQLQQGVHDLSHDNTIWNRYAIIYIRDISWIDWICLNLCWL